MKAIKVTVNLFLVIILVLNIVLMLSGVTFKDGFIPKVQAETSAAEQTKIFVYSGNGSNTDAFEKQINDWLRANGDKIEIIYRLQSSCSSPVNGVRVVSVFETIYYKNK
jgi:ABC-type glycerol-3-phosphate transport system substrate-binding protein